MKMSSSNCPLSKYEPILEVHPMTGASIEVFWADRTLETFGRRGAGWFWWPRRRGFPPDGKAAGPFPTSYSLRIPPRHNAQSASLAMTPLKNGCCASILLPQAQRMEATFSLAQENCIKINELLARPERFERPTLRFVV